MDLNQFIAKYGTQATEELLDKYLIEQSKDNYAWRLFAIKTGIIKQTTKVMRARMNERTLTHEYRNDPVKGFGKFQLDEPYNRYSLILINGRGEYVLSLEFTDIELRSWRETNGDNEA